MYASFGNQFEHLLHFVYAFTLVYIGFAWLLIRHREPMPLFERLVTNYVQMVLFMIVLGYFLIVIKLWEVIMIVTVIVLLSVRLFIRSRNESDRANLVQRWIALFFDWVEKKRSFRNDAREYLGLTMTRAKTYLKLHLFNASSVLFVVSCAAVFGLAVYVRFYDAVSNAASAMSDFAVTLAWVKYIDARILFNDGIYPQGNHIYMNSIMKFAAIDPIYVLKYNGPLNSVLICLSVYYAVSRFASSRYAGLAGAAVYGIFGEAILFGSWERQSAPNSQEFAFVFVLPTMYFLYRYLRSDGKEYVRPLIAGLCVTGLVHTLAFGLVGLGTGAMLFIFLLGKGLRTLPVLLKAAGFALIAVTVSVIPLGLGYLLQREVHSSSANYLTSEQPDYTFMPVYGWDIAAVIACVLLAVYALYARWKGNAAFPAMAGVFVSLFGLGTFALYFAGAKYTGNEVIATRSLDLWGFVSAFALGAGAAVLFHALGKLRSRDWLKFTALGLFVAVGTGFHPVEPIVPYKMEWNETVEQYLKIKGRHPAGTWHIVMEPDGYAMILGNAHHMHTKELLDLYDPAKPPLTLKGGSSPNIRVSPDIYIFYNKQVYRVNKSNSIYELLAGEYAAREENSRRLDEWMKIYEQANGPAEVFYEDDKLKIYHLKRKQTREEIMGQIWGDNG